MKKKSLALILTIIMVLSVCRQAEASDGSSYVYDGYTYDYWFNVKETPAAFELEQVLDSDNLDGETFGSIADVCTSEDGRIFLADKTNGRVYVFSEDGEMLQSIKAIKYADGKMVIDEDGSQLILSSCEGVFVKDDINELYIADPDGMCVVVLDSETYEYLRVIKNPEGMTGTTQFKPSKVAVDDNYRIYVVVQSSYEGIIELNADGTFSRYFGVNSPEVNLIDYFWKMIASDEQKSKMSKTYAPAFNNVAIDGDGFVMAVTNDSSAEDMVFRFSSKGKNVLREEGYTWVIGDVWSMEGEDSQFVDIAVTDYGTYALIDKTKGRIFLYNFDGELLNAFGTLGNAEGQFKNPTSISWLGDKLVVTDGTLNKVFILKPTDFGLAVLRGNEEYYYGHWDEALTYFEEAVKYNANYDVAYSSIGKNYLMKEDYETALYYFKLGYNKTFYSKAYNGYRNNLLRDNFYIVAIVIIALVAAVVYSEVRYYRKRRRRA